GAGWPRVVRLLRQRGAVGRRHHRPARHAHGARHLSLGGALRAHPRHDALRRLPDVTDPRALRVLFVCLVCIGLGQSMLFAILPPAARPLGISPFRISASIWVFVSPWWGRRSDVWGRRPVILIGLLGFGLSMALLATTIACGAAGLLSTVAVYPLLVASRCVFALIGSGTGPASQAYIADRTTTAERAAGLALVSAAM